MKRLAGMDPGIANFGMAAFDARLGDGVELDLVRGDVISTASEVKKRRVSQASSDFARWRFIAEAIRDWLVEWEIGLIAAEERSFARGSAAVKSMSAAWAIIASMSLVLSIPVVVASPKSIKSILCGRETASKAEVEAAVLRRHPVAGAMIELAGVPDGQHNHFFDACGAAEACRRFDEVLAWIR